MEREKTTTYPPGAVNSQHSRRVVVLPSRNMPRVLHSCFPRDKSAKRLCAACAHHAKDSISPLGETPSWGRVSSRVQCDRDSTRFAASNVWEHKICNIQRLRNVARIRRRNKIDTLQPSVQTNEREANETQRHKMLLRCVLFPASSPRLVIDCLKLIFFVFGPLLACM